MKISTITESRGLFARTPGDEFFNAELNQTAVFVNIEKYPELGAFSSTEEMTSQVQSLEDQLGAIEWVNKPTGNKSFAIAYFDLSTGETMRWGRYFREIKPSMLRLWPSKDYPKGWSSTKKTAVKAKRGFQPTDLIGTEKLLTANQAIDLVSTNAPPDDQQVLVQALRSIQNGQLPVFENMASDQAAIRDYFGEIMAPLALMNNLVGGQAQEAQEVLLGDQKWSQCKITWTQHESNPLIDSALHAPNGQIVGLSSKGGDGASSSIINIHQAIEKARTQNPKLIKKFANTVNIIDILNKHSAIEAPLILAQQMNIISKKTQSRVPDLIDQNIQKPQGQFTKQEVKLIMSRNFDFDHPSFNAGAALLASIAAAVAEKINQDSVFGQAIKAFMNQSATVQINLYTAVRGQDVHVTRIQAIYPPNFTGGFVIKHSKNYVATEKPRGKFTLKIK